MGRGGQLRALREAFEVSRLHGTTTVHVGGLAGMGKSTVVRHFIDDLVRRDEAVVLRGRAYERESVPYKAVDSVIDALSLHLLALADEGDPVDLPEDLSALARLFPVLERVPGVDASLAASGDPPSSVRRRAFRALRQVFASLTRRKPVVVVVDDVHWGDADSAALVLELLPPPMSLPLLFLLVQDDARAPSSPFLSALRDRWPEGAHVREVTVGPLPVEDIRRTRAARSPTTRPSPTARWTRWWARDCGAFPGKHDGSPRSSRSPRGRSQSRSSRLHRTPATKRTNS
jgi:predicted ATPase